MATGRWPVPLARSVAVAPKEPRGFSPPTRDDEVTIGDEVMPSVMRCIFSPQERPSHCEVADVRFEV